MSHRNYVKEPKQRTKAYTAKKARMSRHAKMKRALSLKLLELNTNDAKAETKA